MTSSQSPPRSRREIAFRLMLSREDALRLSCEYGEGQDALAEAAGQAIREGQQLFSHLRTIFEWKTRGRGRSRLDANSDEEVHEALGVATAARYPRTAIAVLCGLHGVNIPVASAVMTMIHPQRYTVIDWRALHSLGVNPASGFIIPSLGFFLRYLDFCIVQSTEWRMSLREFDRALWQWSRNEGRSPPSAKE